MTDYAKHIAVLENVGSLSPAEREALTAAIDLMRAAAPKDAYAERAVCIAITGSALYGHEPGSGELFNSVVDHVELSRAAARGEGYAQAVAEKTVFATQAHVACMNELAECKAEIEYLSGLLDQARADDGHCERRNLETKLTNLRAAVEAVAADIEKDRRTGKRKGRFSDGVYAALMIRAALSGADI